MTSHTDRPLRGIVYINAALIVFSCNEVLVRFLTEGYSPAQIAFIWFLVMVCLVAATIAGLRRQDLFVGRR